MLLHVTLNKLRSLAEGHVLLKCAIESIIHSFRRNIANISLAEVPKMN